MNPKKYANEFGHAPVEPSFWFLEAALYHSADYRFDGHAQHGFEQYRQNLLDVFFPSITIDVYCPTCKKETVFAPAEREVDWNLHDKIVVKYGLHYSHFKCSRKNCGSDLYFAFTFLGGIVTKVGQYPSIADLIKPELRKYARVLTPEMMADWQRAVGLRAHGVGAGSYVYLRRIIESIVRKAARIAIEGGNLDAEQFEKARWANG
jgi:hypothetical protein